MAKEKVCIVGSGNWSVTVRKPSDIGGLNLCIGGPPLRELQVSDRNTVSFAVYNATKKSPAFAAMNVKKHSDIFVRTSTSVLKL